MIKSTQTNHPEFANKQTALPAIFDYVNPQSDSGLSVLFVTEDSGIVVSSSSSTRLGNYERQLVSCKTANWVLSQKKFEISN